MLQYQYVYENEESFKEKLLFIEEKCHSLAHHSILVRIFSTNTDKGVIKDICL